MYTLTECLAGTGCQVGLRRRCDSIDSEDVQVCAVQVWAAFGSINVGELNSQPSAGALLRPVADCLWRPKRPVKAGFHRA
jgi:hypothetical protein